MVKKTLMGATVRHLLKELSPEIPEGDETKVENEVSKRLQTILGENWATLPVTGPYMMIAVLVLNYILLPMGVTPITVADKAISKGKEYNLDSRFSELLISAKTSATATGEFTSEKLKELSEYSEEKGKRVGSVFKELFASSQKIGKSLLDKGKLAGKEVLSSFRNSADQDDDKNSANDEIQN